MRTDSPHYKPKTDRNGTWKARATSANGQHSEREKAAGDFKLPDWVAPLTPAQAERLASALVPGLPSSVLTDVMKCQYAEEYEGLDGRRHAERLVFLYADPELRFIGAATRSIDGEKKNLSKEKYGSEVGLLIMNRFRTTPGPVIAPEGYSDTVVSAACGLRTVGRPSNYGSADMLADLVAPLSPDVPVYVVADYDPKEDGSRPGREGAEKTAAVVAAKIRRPVYVADPPPGYKDLRAWAREKVTGSAEAIDWPAMGRELFDHIRETATRIDPPSQPESRFRFIPSDEFAGGDYRPQWLIPNVLEQFTRQFLLLNRIHPYQSDGEHDLWARIGGSAGHGGVWAIHISEGLPDENFGGRKWDVSVASADEVKADTAAKRDAAKQSAAREKMRDEEARVLAAIDSETFKGHPAATQTRIATHSLIDRRKLVDILARMAEDGMVEQHDFEKTTGQGAKTKCKGWRRVAKGEPDLTAEVEVRVHQKSEAERANRTEKKGHRKSEHTNGRGDD